MKRTSQTKPTAPDKQKTLLQFWRGQSSNNLLNGSVKNNEKKGEESTLRKVASFNPKSSTDDSMNQLANIPNQFSVDEENEDEDLELIKACETYMNADNSENNLSTLNPASDDCHADKLSSGIDDQIIQSTQFFDTAGFDYASGSVWIYPNNMALRSYQFAIVEQCLFKNTMVVLPTGLGKTFIASVVMFNFYRWYPLGKIIFMAPTKPLVNQQSDACYKIVGITKEDMTQMTGQMAPEKRKALWSSKRVFFLTPQVLSNDILRGIVDVNWIKCVVIDEAHKALGEYAFCKVIESINEVNKNFRIVALTATPGSDVKAIQNIITKLLISHIELRSDDSADLQQYSNSREVNKFVLKINPEILEIKNAYLNVIKTPLKRLEMSKALSCKDPSSLSKFMVLERREFFRKTLANSMDGRRAGQIESDFALLVTLLHGLELLNFYGVRSLYMFLKSFVENTDGSKSAAQVGKLKAEIMNSPEMAAWYEKFRATFDQKDSVIPRSLRHPKLLKLEEVILEHFAKFEKTSTRVMIFSQYRESVYEITAMLCEHSEIKAMEFVGQSGSGQGGRKSVTQKEQLSVVKKFRDGGYNTLVSTCVGEEGLDIGEIDLIICYDAQKSPIRLIQRMGRTGRKREGRIIILLTEGKEEASYLTSLSKKRTCTNIF